MSILDGLSNYDIGQLRKGRITLNTYIAAVRIATDRKYEAGYVGVTISVSRLIIDALNEMTAAARKSPNAPCARCHALSTAIQELAKLERDEQ